MEVVKQVATDKKELVEHKLIIKGENEERYVGVLGRDDIKWEIKKNDYQ